MQVKLISSNDMHGGANIAAFRLLQGLKSVGLSSAELVVQNKFSGDPAVTARMTCFCKMYGRLLPYLDPLPKLLYPKRHRDAWSCNILPNPCLGGMLASADVINLHWVGGGTLPIQAIGRLNKPIVWTLHDSWAFTGGCHIPYDCTRYEDECGHCPQLRSGRERDLSRTIWEKKLRAWQRLQMLIVAPSTWMASTATTSSLFENLPIEVIPNGLDTTIFNVADKQEARRVLGLPERTQLVLFFAMGGINNWNKGADLLSESLGIIKAARPNDELMLVTAGTRSSPPAGYFPVPCINLGRVDDDRQKRLMYAAVDLTAVPSRSESLGYVAMESMACGTPCVGFSIGGLPDIVDHRVNGFLAEPYSTNDFSAGITWLLAERACSERVCSAAREKIIAKFCHIKTAQQYRDSYVRSFGEKLL